jgi:Ca2+-binding EF-hand superfamily protein
MDRALTVFIFVVPVALGDTFGVMLKPVAGGDAGVLGSFMLILAALLYINADDAAWSDLFDNRPMVDNDVLLAFQAFDSNRSGKLDYKELMPALIWLGFEASEEQAALLVRRYDANSSGLLDLSEFAELVSQWRAWQQLSTGVPVVSEVTKREIKATFDVFDADGSGLIDVDELKGAMRAQGFKATDREVRKMMAEVDEDESGEIDFEEFLLMMTQKGPLTLLQELAGTQGAATRLIATSSVGAGIGLLA